MIILGIDPGVARLGYGVLETRHDRILASCHGCLETDKATPHGDRLLEVRDRLRELIAKYKPELVAVEKLFFETNARTAIVVGEARGVVMLTAAEAKLPVVEMTPLQVKQTVTGSGSADKKQVQKMIQVLLNLKEVPKPDDAADALAIAICGMRYAASASRLAAKS